MAEFRLTKKSQQQPQEVVVNQPQLDQEQQAGLLSTLGGGAMSGLHTIGSLMSTPSRAIWGTINGIAGGEGGYGNMNPWDSTGGIEASHVLGNAGVIAKNDPTRWELIPKFQNGQINPGDLGRGIIDMLGDPTSYIGVGAVTKAGSRAAREGARIAGFTNQLRAGHRAALTFGLPFSEASHAIGTGENAARIFEATGIPKLSAKISESAPVRYARGAMDATYRGMTHKDVQKYIPEMVSKLEDLKHDNISAGLRMASQRKKAGLHSIEDEDNLRLAMEGLGGHDPHGHAKEISDMWASKLAKDKYLGTGKETLNDKVMKEIDGVMGMHDARKYSHRQMTAGAKSSKANQAAGSPLAREGGSDKEVKWWLRGFHRGTTGVNEFSREYTRGARNKLYDIIDSSKGLGEKDLAKNIEEGIGEHYGNVIDKWHYTPKTLRKIAKYEGKIGAHEKLKLDLDAKQAQLAGMSADDIAKHGLDRHAAYVEKVRSNLENPEYMKMIPEKAVGAHIKAKDKLRAIVDSPSELGKLTVRKQNQIVKRLSKLESMTMDEVRSGAADSYQRRLERAIMTPKEKVVELAVKSHPKLIEKIGKQSKVLADEKIPALVAAKELALKERKNRHAVLAKNLIKMSKDDAIRKKGLFGNDPIADTIEGRKAADRRHVASETVYKILGNAPEYHGEDGVRLGDWLDHHKYDSKIRKTINDAGEEVAEYGPAVHRVAEHAGIDADSVANKMLDPEMLNDMKTLTPKITAPPAEGKIAKAFRSGMSWWKGGTLAWPASRTRDAMGGAIWNALHGWVNPKYMHLETNRLLSGKNLKEDYTHIGFVKDWLAKTGLPPTPDNQTEAVRQLVGTYLPSESNMLADVATGQHSTTLDHVMHNMPGQVEKPFIEQVLVDPVKTLVGRGTPSSSGEVPSWFGHGEKGEGLISRLWKAVKQQGRMRGVADQDETLLAPVRASEQMSAGTDQYNRVGPFLDMTAGKGFDPKEAGRRVNTAQVDYDPDKYTASEKWIKNYVSPFYSFNSRMLQSTAGQLADLKSPTAQLIKALDRAKSSSDPSVPDYVMSQTGTSFGEDRHGNKRYLVGAGLMHDPAVSMIGLLAGGNVRPAMYDTLSMLGPHIGIPLQRTVGQSFFQRGEPIGQLDPTIPRLISNIGETTGLMAPDPHAIDRFKYPGYQHVDTVLGALPYSREVNALRTVMDPRKDLITKGLDTMTGLKIQTISPEKQLATLKKRAEKLAEESGGYKYSRVIMPAEQKEALRAINPMLAAKQDKLEVMLKEIYGKKKRSEAKQSEEFRLKKKKKE